MNAKTPIEFRSVEKYFGKQHVLRGVDLTVKAGECLVIIGRSGCGKSVLLKNLVGLMKPNKGAVLVDGENIVPLRESELVPIRKKIGIVFQGGALFDSLTVEENVAFPLQEEKILTPREIKERVAEVLEAVGLPNQQHKKPDELSGGMRKRVALARAIIRKPEALLYDEPTTGLDPIIADSINKMIDKMNESYGVTSIVVTHDMKSAYYVADRIAMLHEGRIYTIDTPEGIQKNQDPIVKKFIDGISEENDITF